jgi:predicted alpha/beta hydrolase
MVGLGFVAQAAGTGASTIFNMLWYFLGPVAALLVSVLTELVSTLSCVTFGACVGVIIGVTVVKQWRRYRVRKDKQAVKNAAVGLALSRYFAVRTPIETASVVL